MRKEAADVGLRLIVVDHPGPGGQHRLNYPARYGAEPNTAGPSPRRRLPRPARTYRRLPPRRGPLIRSHVVMSAPMPDVRRLVGEDEDVHKERPKRQLPGIRGRVQTIKRGPGPRESPL